MSTSHGTAAIEREGQVLLLEISGSWNLEGYLDFVGRFKAAAAPLTAKPWGVLVDVRNWGLSTPDIDAVDKDVQLWTLQNNQRWRAFVSDESFLKRAQIDRSAKPVRSEIETRYFTSVEEARKWFEELGLFKP